MEQSILASLQGLEGKVKATNKNAGLTFEFGGTINIQRGNFSKDISFYAKVYETKHKGVLGLDDWDVHDTYNYNLNGLPIDNVTAFKTKLSDWGLSGVANKLTFSNEEERQAICMAMLEDETLKKIFGNDFKVLELLSTEEKNQRDLKYVVENFESCVANFKQQVARNFGIAVENETPTLKDFKKKLAEVSK